MRRQLLGMIFLLVPLGMLSAGTGARMLLVARDLDEHPLAGFRFAYAGVASQPTNSAGATELDLPPNHPPGQQIRIQLLAGSKQAEEWFLVAPQINIPSGSAPAEVVLMQRSGLAAARNIIKRNDEAKAVTQAEKNAIRDEVAKQVHLRGDELQVQMRSLAKLTTDPDTQAVVTRYNQDYPYDFAISQGLLDSIRTIRGLRLRLRGQIIGIGPVHQVANDCEMQIAGRLDDISPGNPAGFLIEPPNVCHFPPPGEGSPMRWRSLLTAATADKSCEIEGFPRIFLERYSPEYLTNPNHFFEIHPALALRCGTWEVTFDSFLTSVPGMRVMTSAMSAECFSHRALELRYNADQSQYEFRELGPHCGNFAVVRIERIRRSSAETLSGGHAVTATIATDETHSVELTLYTLTPSAIDAWIGGATGAPVNGAAGFAPRFVIGMLTYDFRTILRIAGQSRASGQWMQVPSPIALVLFGDADQETWSD